MTQRERLRFATILVAVALTAFAPATLAAQTSDPVHGTWTLDPTRSKFTPGPAPQGLTVTFAPAGEGLRVTSELVDAEGRTVRTEYTAYYDSRDYPLKGTPAADMVSMRRIDASTSERVDKSKGKTVMTYVRRVSADGKTLTVTQTGIDAQGRIVRNLVVLTKK
jgi:hypothetical protein